MENEGQEKESEIVTEVNLKEDFQASGVADILAELDNSCLLYTSDAADDP